MAVKTAVKRYPTLRPAACAVLAAAATVLGPAAADGMPDDGTEPQMSELRLPAIQRISIEQTGSKSPAAGDNKVDCTPFRVTREDVAHYLTRAGAISERDFWHTVPWSPCSSSGTVSFKDGLTGQWTLQEYLAGSLRLSDGRQLYLYCPDCKLSVEPRPTQN